MDKQQKNYADRLRAIRDMEGEKMAKLKYLFATFYPACHRAIIQHLAGEKLKGEDFIPRKDLIAEIRDVHNFEPPLITISLRRMYYLGIISKRKRFEFLEREVCYGLSDMFEEVSKAVCILEDLLGNITPEQLDVYRRRIHTDK